jgi:hypothetical protein
VVRIMDPHPQPHVHTAWWDQRQNFNSLSKLFFISYKCPMHFKLKSQFSRLWH